MTQQIQRGFPAKIHAENPACPQCGSQFVRKNGTRPSGRQRFMCAKCGYGFSDSAFVPKPRVKDLDIDCPSCHSRSVTKNGLNRSGSQVFRCKDCRASFTDYTYSVKRGWKQEKREKVQVFVPKREPRPAPLIIYKPKQTVDSLVGIPCFCCDQMNLCRPEFCEKLRTWTEKQ